MAVNRPKKEKPAAKKETVTCPHCRYEHPAKDKRCHLCGYPWHWSAKQRK